jgi:hypothetical protein
MLPSACQQMPKARHAAEMDHAFGLSAEGVSGNSRHNNRRFKNSIESLLLVMFSYVHSADPKLRSPLGPFGVVLGRLSCFAAIQVAALLHVA